MHLPFTFEQFMNIFIAYNTAVWPAQIILNILGISAVVLCLRKVPPSGIIAGLLAVLWAWTGLVYHMMFFRLINPAATVFGLMCVVQAILFIAVGILKPRITFRTDRSWQVVTGWILVAYSLVIYPLLGSIQGHVYPASPTFGAPCPATIFTFGMLVWTVGRVPWYVIVIPAIWSAVGFTAAFTLGIREDVGLLIAGIAGVLILTMAPRPAGPSGT